MQVTFYGVRGSTPCPSERNARYGGNTSCVAVEFPDQAPIVFDLGTGVRAWGETQPDDGSFQATALVTHFHFDHVQGLPFLAAADRPGSRISIYGPGEAGRTVSDLCAEFVRPPYFPISISELRGTYDCIDVLDADFAVGEAKVKARPVPHVGTTLGYRVDWQGRSVAYISDHQGPKDLGDLAVPDSVLELCDGVDLVIHDAQYTEKEWSMKSHWGHCTVAYAVNVAAQAGAKALALFHHDPMRSDPEVDQLLIDARGMAALTNLEIMAAGEGMKVTLGEPLSRQVKKRPAIGPMFQPGR